MQRNKKDSHVIKQPTLDSFSNPHEIVFFNYSFNWILNENNKKNKTKPAFLTENVPHVTFTHLMQPSLA